MNNISLILNEEGFGKFSLDENGKEIAKMEISISDNYLTAYHTEVQPEFNGKGLAKQLFDFMVNIAQNKRLKIIPLCVYVRKQLERNPLAYQNLIEKDL